MKIDRKEALAALAALEAGTGKSGEEPVTMRGGRAWSFDRKLAASVELDMGADCVIRTKELTELLRRLPDDVVEVMAVNDGLEVSGGRSRSWLRTVAEKEAPAAPPEVPDDGWSPLPDGFREALETCLASVNKDAAEGFRMLATVHLTGSMAESCDNYRATRAEWTSGELDGAPVALPAEAAAELAGRDLKEWATDGAWAHFRTSDGVTLSVLLQGGEYPDLDALFEVDGTKAKLPAEMKAVLDRAAIFTKSDFSHTDVVRVRLSKDGATLRGEGDAGWHEEGADVKWKGPAVEFGVNPRWLGGALGKVRVCTVGKDKIRFDAAGWHHVVCLAAD